METIPEHIKEKFEKAGIRILIKEDDFHLRELVSKLSDEMIDAVILVSSKDYRYRRLEGYDLSRIITQLAPSRTEDLLKHQKKHVIKQDFRNRQRFHNKKL